MQNLKLLKEVRLFLRFIYKTKKGYVVPLWVMFLNVKWWSTFNPLRWIHVHFHIESALSRSAWRIQNYIWNSSFYNFQEINTQVNGFIKLLSPLGRGRFKSQQCQQHISLGPHAKISRLQTHKRKKIYHKAPKQVG